MANNFVFRAVVFILLLFFCFPFFAQEIPSPENDSLEEEELGSVEDTWQILEWKEENPEYVLYYEVIVEQLDSKSDEYIQIVKERTSGNETRFSPNPRLAPGRYRFKVVTYNLIGLAEVESDFYEFAIIRAFQPRITGISSNANNSSTIYMEELNDGIFEISGRNLFLPEYDEETQQKTVYELFDKRTKRKIIPEILSHEKNNRSLKVKFDMDVLDTGVYNFFATDASGLKNEENKDNIITVKFKKMFDFDISAGYACPIVLYDTTIPYYMAHKVWPLGATAKGTFIFSKHKFGYFGAALNMHYHRMSRKEAAYNVSGNVFDAFANFVFQKPIYIASKRHSGQQKHFMTLEVRAGVGVMFLNNFVYKFPNNIKSAPLNSCYFALQAGVSAQFFVKNRLFIEAGLDFTHAFAKDMQLGELVPSVGVGWQF